jgi:hypothetical protein
MASKLLSRIRGRGVGSAALPALALVSGFFMRRFSSSAACFAAFGSFFRLSWWLSTILSAYFFFD